MFSQKFLFTFSKFLKPKQCPLLKCTRKLTSKIELDVGLRKTPPMSVTIVGANTEVGRISSLLFKYQTIFEKLILYDRKSNTEEIGNDLKQINTSVQVQNCWGKKDLEAAVSDSRIIYICTDSRTIPKLKDELLFYKNAHTIRQVIYYLSVFNPFAMVVILTPPISAFVPLAVEEFRKNEILAAKRVFGPTTLLASRANVIASEFTQGYVKNCFTIGGCEGKSIVPILSQSDQTSKLTEVQMSSLSVQIQNAGESLLTKKLEEGDDTGYFLSTAFCGVNFTVKLAEALNGKPNITEYAFVKQTQLEQDCTRYCASLVKLNQKGLESTQLPKLSTTETVRFSRASDLILTNIHLAENYITGDDIVPVHRPLCIEKTEIIEAVLKDKHEEEKKEETLCKKSKITKLEVPMKKKSDCKCK